MKLRIVISTALLAVSLMVVTALALPRHPLPAEAAPTTGSIMGRVVWNAPIPVPYGAVPGVPGQAVPDQSGPGDAVPLPAPTAPDISPAPSPGAGTDTAPDASEAVPAPGIQIRPVPRPYPRLIPAGAVLVAIQGTNLSARTDDQGRFRIDGVPTGQYLTVAAGPVQNVTTAVAVRPNAYIQDSGGTIDLGLLYLGQGYGVYGPMPYSTAPGAAVPDTGQSESTPTP
jgi:hypothetical protein